MSANSESEFNNEIPPILKQAQSDFPVRQNMKITLGPTFIEYKRVFTGTLIALTIITVVFGFIGISLAIAFSSIYPLFFLIGSFLPGMFAYKLKSNNTQLLAIDMALNMIYASDKDIPFDDIISLQIVSEKPIPKGRKPRNFSVYNCFGLKFNCKDPLNNTMILRMFSNDYDHWFSIGKYFSMQLFRFFGREIPLLDEITTEKTTERCMYYQKVGNSTSVNWS
jgi:hypothetical protein